MSRYGRRMTGVVLGFLALLLLIEAASFQWEYHGANMRAYAQWQSNPTPATEAAWRAASAERHESEEGVRWVLGLLGLLLAVPSVWLVASMPRHPDIVCLAVGRPDSSQGRDPSNPSPDGRRP